MRLVFELSKENLELSAEEVIRLIDPKDRRMIKNYMLCTTSSKRFVRLAQTKRAYKFLFACSLDNLEENIEKFDFRKEFSRDFSVTATGNKTIKAQELGRLVYKNLKEKVNLKDPSTKFHFIFISNWVICCKNIWENKEDFQSRKAHKRPELHPTSLHPRLARTAVNLAGTCRKIVDPFCGSGGILIEAGLMGLRCEGWDIDPIMLRRAEINLKHFGVKDFILKNKDAFKIGKTFCVVTDPPYGKNTREKDTQELYRRFLSRLKDKDIRKAVIIHPKEIDLKIYTDVKKEFDIYIHRSMTRTISLLEP